MVETWTKLGTLGNHGTSCGLRIICIVLVFAVSVGAEDSLAKATRALEAANFVHGKSRTLPAPGEGIRPRMKSRRDGDAGFTERSGKDASYSVKLRHTNAASSGGSSRLRRERAKEEKWKRIAGLEKKQIEADKHDAAYAASQLQDALNDIFHDPGNSKGSTHCDANGCWSIDTSDATTQATLQAFRDAATSSSSSSSSSSPSSRTKPLSAVASAAQVAVAATAADVAAIDGISAKMRRNQQAMQRNRPKWSDDFSSSSSSSASHRRSSTGNNMLQSFDDSGKPLAKNRRPRCESPWHHSSTAEGACVYARRRCRQRSGLFDYQAIPYCTFGSYPVLGLLVMLVWLFALAVWLGMAADEFLCPCLSVMARQCRMSETVAGVTFLAIGNGAPDIFSQVAAAVATPHGAEMALGEVLGSSLIVVGVVLGIVASAVPFPLSSPEFVRDVLFFLGALLWLFCILLDSAISTWESTGFVGLYGVYIYAVVTGWGVKKGAQNQFQRPEADPVARAEAEAEKKLQLHAAAAGEGHDRGTGARGAKQGPWATELLDALNPFDKTARDGTPWEKLMAGVKAPGLLLMRLSSPVASDSEVNTTWSKPAVLVQLTLCPLILAWCFLLHGFSTLSPAALYMIYTVALLLGGGAGMLVHLTSTRDCPPPYYTSLAFLGFVTSVAWIYALAAELVHLLQAMGTMLEISDTLLGLTVLAFANSVGDLVANLAMARAGMPTMAAAACIGAPLVNLLVGVGGATLLGNLLVQSPYPFEMNLQLYVSLLFLLFALVAILVYIWRHGLPVEVGAPFGGVLILVYLAFLVTCLGLEAWGGQALLKENFGKEMRAMS